MRISWRRTAIYGIFIGLVAIAIRDRLKLRAKIAKLHSLVVTDDILVDKAVERGYFYFKDRQAIVLTKTSPILLKPGEGYFKHGGIFLFLPIDLMADDIHEALKDSAYYLEHERNVINRGLPMGAHVILKRNEWDSEPLPTPENIARILAHYFRTNGVISG